MNDPWADVRDKATTDEHDGWCISWANEHLSCDCHLSLLRTLLTDADALLAVAQLAEDMFQPEFDAIVDHGPDELLKDLAERRNKLRKFLATLPKHLRGDINERSRKA